MALEKLTITPEEGNPIKALFNPERYTVNKSVQFADIHMPGLDSSVVQFVHGQNEKITLELFFDTTESGMVENVQDVRNLTGQVYQLLKVNGKLHAPPRCELTWGEKQLFSGTKQKPKCVLESVSEEFNLFSPTGVPLRAKLNVTFREAWTIEDQLKETPRESADRTRIRQVKRGETLSHVAAAEYEDARLWRPIAEANNLDNPRHLAPGSNLLIPRITPGNQ